MSHEGFTKNSSRNLFRKFSRWIIKWHLCVCGPLQLEIHISLFACTKGATRALILSYERFILWLLCGRKVCSKIKFLWWNFLTALNSRMLVFSKLLTSCVRKFCDVELWVGSWVHFSVTTHWTNIPRERHSHIHTDMLWKQKITCVRRKR